MLDYEHVLADCERLLERSMVLRSSSEQICIEFEATRTLIQALDHLCRDAWVEAQHAEQRLERLVTDLHSSR